MNSERLLRDGIDDVESHFDAAVSVVGARLG